MIAHGKEIKVFTANANVPFAKGICAELGLDLGDSTVTAFADGEVSVSINESVRGCDVFVVQSTCKPVNNNLMELLIMIDAFRRASAGRITAVIPYFGYARQDRKAKGRDPISAKLVANLITRAGADRVLTMDLHAAQIQGFFDIPVDNMLATRCSPVIICPSSTRSSSTTMSSASFRRTSAPSPAPARSRPRSTWALPSWTSAVSAPTCARS